MGRHRNALAGIGGRADFNCNDDNARIHDFLPAINDMLDDVPSLVPFLPLSCDQVVANETGKFKTPTLRNVSATGPYFHNGFAKTLKEVVHFYNTRDTDPIWPASEFNVPNIAPGFIVGNLGLTPQEEDAIVAFLKTLTDTSTLNQARIQQAVDTATGF